VITAALIAELASVVPEPVVDTFLAAVKSSSFEKVNALVLVKIFCFRKFGN
jgi:hypothetical protein